MRGALAIYRRELAGLFVTPLGWVLLLLALVLQGVFVAAFLRVSNGDVSDSLQACLGGSYHYWALLALLPPLLTMRMLSEESRTGMLEYLLTAPVSDAAVVVGKVGAATTFMVVLWTTNLFYGLLFQALGAAPDWGQVFAGYLGAVFTSALFCAAGLVCSALTSLPMLAAFLAFLLNLLLVTLNSVVVGLVGPYRRDILDPLALFDVIGNLTQSFLIGVFDTANVIFFVAWTAVLLVLATRLLEARRWW